MQLSLVPLQIIEVDWRQGDEGEGADLRRWGTGQDGHEYAIKDAVEHPLQPASEYFCYELARRCKIPVPHYEVVRLPDQGFAFGSRWEGSALARDRSAGDRCPATRFWQRLGAHVHLAPVFSSIHALDLFVHNGDRHLGNYLPATSRTKFSVSAFDFGRAWWFRWPVGTRLLGQEENTVKVFRHITRSLPFDVTSACQVLDRIAAIDTPTLQDWVEPLTPYILPAEHSKSLYAWWGSSERAARLRVIRSHVTHAKYPH